MLTYRLPREPPTPRSSVWRKLRRLGVAQLADGLVALPAEQAADASPVERRRVLRALRADLRRIRRRDFFPPAVRDAALIAAESLADDASRIPSAPGTSVAATVDAPRGGEGA